MKIIRLIVINLTLLLLHLCAFANDTIIFSDENIIVNIGSQIEILEDRDDDLEVDEVLKSKQFKPSNEKVPNLGVSQSSFWLRFKVVNNSNAENIVLQLAYPIMDEVVLYSFTSEEEYQVFKMGDSRTFFPRKYKHQNFIFDLTIRKGQTHTYLLKVKSREQILLPLNIGIPKSIIEANNTKDLLFGLYAGAILIIFLYNLFLFFTVRDISYLYYIIYILTIALTQAALQAYPFRFLWPGYPWFANYSIILFPAIAGIATVEFVKNFLRTKHFVPVLHKGLYIITLIYCFAIIINFFGFPHLSYRMIDLNAAFISLYTLLVAISTAIKGYRPAKFFLIAWSVFLIGVILFVLKNIGVLPDNNLTNYIMSIGTILEVSLLSFALADRINILKKEKEASQKRTLEISLENEQLVIKQNITLERKVNERTRELHQSNKTLTKTLEDLKSAQSKLIESQKMASLGQLTAGIAHEINNPINFVKSNVRPLKRDINRLYQLIEKYEEIKFPERLADQLKNITVFKEEIEIDFLKEEITALLSGIDDGASRTAKIVEGLKAFSRLGNASFSEYDLTVGIESCLTILRHRLSSSEIDIDKNYAPSLIVECLPDRINQVFMNILDNAIDALSTIKGQKRITIATKKSANNIEVSFTDNGIGMNNEIQERIFDPFYTSKDVGSGVGLGLSIAYGIIRDHNGEIQVTSSEGKGTTFTIILLDKN